MLKTSLLFFRSQLGKIADKVHDEIVRDENKSSDTTFESKKSKNANSKNLLCV